MDIKSDAMNMILRQRRTEKQLVDALVKKGHSVEDAKSTARYYRENGYIDHQDYANRFVHDAAVLKGFGPERIVRDLQMRGIEDACIEEALSAIEFDVKTPMEKRFGSGQISYRETQKIYAYFMRKGFSSSAIKAAIRALYTYE